MVFSQCGGLAVKDGTRQSSFLDMVHQGIEMVYNRYVRFWEIYYIGILTVGTGGTGREIGGEEAGHGIHNDQFDHRGQSASGNNHARIWPVRAGEREVFILHHASLERKAWSG